MSEKPRAPATERNRHAILEVLLREFTDAESVLEIGSGTGQHAVFFAKSLPHLYWQTSDRSDNHEGIIAWIKDSGLTNVGLPVKLDVLQEFNPELKFDAVFSANTAHIMSMAAVSRMFEIVASVLDVHGKFCLYGPFNHNGQFLSESNRAFDQSLRSQDSEMGIRDLEEIGELARQNGLSRLASYAMPANNQAHIWTAGNSG